MTEQEKRRNAFRQANAILLLEGAQVTSEELVIQERIIRGEMTFDEAVKEIIAEALLRQRQGS